MLTSRLHRAVAAAALPARPAVWPSVTPRRRLLLPARALPPAVPFSHRRCGVCAAASKKGSSGGSGSGGESKQQQQPPTSKSKQQQGDADADADDVIYLDDDDDDDGDDDEGMLLLDEYELGGDDDDEEDEDGGGWLEDDEFDAASDDSGGGQGGVGEEDPVQPGAVSTHAAPWGAAALAAAREVLSGPGFADVELFALRCFPAPARVDVRLDKLTDKYGSPLLEDIEGFSRRFGAKLEEALGAEKAGEIVMEVSSPGAERELALPGELRRFAALPLRVEFDGGRAEVVEGGRKKKAAKRGGGGGDQQGEEGQQQQQEGANEQQQQQQQKGTSPASSGVAILELVALDEAAGTSEWRLADVRANAPGKGRGLSKRQREQKWMIPVDALQRARVHVDF